MSIIKTIKIKMVELELNQAELAEKAGINVSVLSQTLTNKRSPQQKTLVKIAKAIGMTYAELISTGE